MTDFNYINPLFTTNSQEERLLGVSLSGIMDNKITAKGEAKVLAFLRDTAIATNVEWAEKLGLNPSTSVTCVKPDGNTSVLYNTAPGIHGRYAPFYIRRMRIAANTPLANYVLSKNVLAEPALGETWENVRTLVLSFPVKSPEGAVIQRERSAITQQLCTVLTKKKRLSSGFSKIKNMRLGFRFYRQMTTLIYRPHTKK
jgi:ribonucleoside-triphosphate reductase (thioredoxin)